MSSEQELLLFIFCFPDLVSTWGVIFVSGAVLDELDEFGGFGSGDDFGAEEEFGAGAEKVDEERFG